MKARVDNESALRSRLEAECRRQYDFLKEDVYYRAPSIVDGSPFECRIRTELGQSLCTFKKRRMDRGMEFNREVEFEVGDADKFGELMAALGCRVVVTKRKRGTLYRMGELSVELTEVEGLGLFLEVERLLSDEEVAADPGVAGRADSEIRDLFRRLAVPTASIEPRRYNDMLLAAVTQQGII